MSLWLQCGVGIVRRPGWMWADQPAGYFIRHSTKGLDLGGSGRDGDNK